MPGPGGDVEAKGMNRLLTSAAVAVSALALTATAHAGTLLTWSGQSWHFFQSTGKLGQVWSPTMVSVDSAGTLHERIHGNTAGGVGSTAYQTYGTWSADFRITPGAGKFVILLAGHEGTPFNELDIAESSVGDSGRTQITATRHWGVGKANLSQHRIAGDFTQWHTVSVSWTAAHMTVYMDGVRFARYITHISHTPMHLTIQTAGANVGGPGADAELQVKNLHVAA
jgi:Glycosyl hydrolases family 16